MHIWNDEEKYPLFILYLFSINVSFFTILLFSSELVKISIYQGQSISRLKRDWFIFIFSKKLKCYQVSFFLLTFKFLAFFSLSVRYFCIFFFFQVSQLVWVTTDSSHLQGVLFLSQSRTQSDTMMKATLFRSKKHQLYSSCLRQVER